MATTAIQKSAAPWSRFGLFAGLALVSAPVMNGIVYSILNALGMMDDSIIPAEGGEPITLIPVVLATIMAVVSASVVYGLLLAFTQRPLRWFMLISVGVLAVSFVPTASLEGIPAEMTLALNIMHLIAAGIIIGLFSRVNRPA
ncbi:MAG: DUF6069 family protein [Anaerolineales bacterium]